MRLMHLCRTTMFHSLFEGVDTSCDLDIELGHISISIILRSIFESSGHFSTSFFVLRVFFSRCVCGLEAECQWSDCEAPLRWRGAEDWGYQHHLHGQALPCGLPRYSRVWKPGMRTIDSCAFGFMSYLTLIFTAETEFVGQLHVLDICLCPYSTVTMSDHLCSK